MRKKILIMIFAVSLIASLQGCNNIPVEENNVPDEENNGIVEEVQTPETVEPVQKTVEEQRLEIKEGQG